MRGGSRWRASPAMSAHSAPATAPEHRLGGIAGVFLRLGCTSFGGPVAHLGYLREEFVVRRRWLDDAAFADVVALCQFLPGPASSQVVYALGMQRAGLAGALVASACFTLPSAVLMILFAYGVIALGDLRAAGWLHGLKVAAVAVVAQAVWGMGRRLCPDAARVSLAIAAAAVLLFVPHAAVQVGVIAAGAAVGWLLYRSEAPTSQTASKGLARSHLWAAGVLGICGALLVTLPLVATATGSRFVIRKRFFSRWFTSTIDCLNGASIGWGSRNSHTVCSAT